METEILVGKKAKQFSRDGEVHVCFNNLAGYGRSKADRKETNEDSAEEKPIESNHCNNESKE